MEADITIQITDEQLEKLLNNEKFIYEFAQQMTNAFTECGTYHFGGYENKILDALIKGISDKLIQSEIEQIKSTIGKRVDAVITKVFSKTVQELIVQKLDKEA